MQKSKPRPRKHKPKAWTPDEIRALRKLLGETQVEFAARVGVSEMAVVQWEQEKTKNGLPNLRHRNPSRMAKKVFERIESDHAGK